MQITRKRVLGFLAMLVTPFGFTTGLSLYSIKKAVYKDLLDQLLGVLIAVIITGIVAFGVIIPKSIESLEKCSPNCTIGEPMGMIPLTVALALFVLSITIVRSPLLGGIEK